MTDKRSNQEKAPIAAAFVKQMRAVFGEDQVKVLYVKEGDFELGEPDGLDKPIANPAAV